ncbi:MAG: AAR2 pre-mRNA splicing protein, partial [Ardenticatenales bacterium]|nr:AAR2 pre-mRNA splicing protein [Ardenticatenales bacterium]
MSTSYIILRDIPKEEARLDLASYPIEGGFRGFQQVLSGAHYVGVRSGEAYKGFWCYLPSNSALVRRFDYEKDDFENDDPESEAQFQQMALTGAMNRALALAHPLSALTWMDLTDHIGPESFPPTLHQETPMT